MEKNKITLSQIGLYNPQRLSDEMVEKLFVVRIKFFQFILEKINKEKASSIPQHYLIVAQRGMGKTTILKRLEVELRKSDYQNIFIPLLFPEEQYNLKNLSELWINSLDALADTLETEKKFDEAKTIDAKVIELRNIKDDEILAKEAYKFLKSFTFSLNRRPVLLIDNMSFVFDRINKDEQHTLRAWLMQNGAPIIIGASAVAIEDTFNYGAPFYDAFQIHYLKKLSFEELLEILNNLATLTQTEEVLPAIQNQMARLKTLHQLTGGNPRTASMLFRLIVKGFSQDINEDLEALLDEITPLYKARFEELSQQMQVIIDAIALHWDPINLEELRNETRYENNQISPQLKRLVEAGWIDRIDAYKAKGNAYQISERLFNVWFIMRRSSRRQKKELYCLSKFLESFYGEDILSVAKSFLNTTSCNLNHLSYSLALANIIIDNTLREQLINRYHDDLLSFAKIDPLILNDFEMQDKSKQNKIRQLFEEYYKCSETKDLEKTERILEILEKITLSDNRLNAAILNESGNFNQYTKKCFDVAEIKYKESIKKNKELDFAWSNLGRLYTTIRNFNQAKICFQKGIDLNPNNVFSWIGIGNLYQYHLKDYSKAEKAYLSANKFDDDEKYGTRLQLGNIYFKQKNFDKAEQTYLDSIKLKNKATAWNNLGNLYQDGLNQIDKAKNAYKQSIELDEKLAFPWNGLGNLYQFKLKNIKKAELSYKKAIETDDTFSNPWNGLGILYQLTSFDYFKSEKAFLKAIEIENKSAYWLGLADLYQFQMKNYTSAEKAYKTAIDIDPNDFTAWNSLGNLYHYCLNNNIEAENSYKKAIEINNEAKEIWNSLGNLYHDNMKLFDLAEFAYKQSISLDNAFVFPKSNLVFLYRDKMKRLDDAKKVFSTIELKNDLEDTFWLNKSLFELYKRNEGIAKEYFIKALGVIKVSLPQETQDDWWRFGSVVLNLGYGNWAYSVLEETGYAIILSPYYVALRAMTEKNPEAYLNSKAVEIREPARKLIELMKRY